MSLKAYRTVSCEAETEITIQKSRFIGRCFPVSEEASALEILARLKKQHWDASHNCYAYAVGADAAIARYSDDGEPGGTAGLPMMEALKNKAVTDVLCVVTRYFGGVLLGAGGLVRAYSKAASQAIEEAEPVWMKPCAQYAMEVAYNRWGSMETLLPRFGELSGTEFLENVRVRIAVPLEQEAAFIQAVTEKSDGRIRPERIGEKYGMFPDTQ